jgi:hypothetical protein
MRRRLVARQSNADFRVRLSLSMRGSDPYGSLSRDELRVRLQSAETVISEQRKLLQAKENLLQKYIQQFSELTANYQNMIDSHYACNDHPVQAAYSLEETEFGFGPLPGLNDPPPPHDPFVSFEVDLPAELPVHCPSVTAQPVAPQNDAPLTRQRMFQSSLSFCDEDPQPARKAAAVSRAAMEDHFAEPVKCHAAEPLPLEFTGLSADQMRAKVDELSVERAELERKLNKAMPKGKVMSHLIREREELEARFNDVSRTISRIKLAIRHSSA